MERYLIHKKIGSGNYAKVYLATDTYTEERVALKLIQKRKLRGDFKATQRVHAEMANMRKLESHQNIVTLYDSFETREHFVLVMEYASHGDLFDHLIKLEGMKESSGREMFRGILNGMKHCHNHGIAHRDLKPENILLTKGNKPKIADFGFSNFISPQPIYSSSVGSLLYSSPEIIEDRPYQGPECDIWSLGVTLYTMLTATMPFDDSNMGDFIVKIENGEYPPPLGVSDIAKDLISKMLDPNPLTRYTIEDVLSHPWMAQLDMTTHPALSRRRFGISYDTPDAIYNMLMKLSKYDVAKCSGWESSAPVHNRYDNEEVIFV